MDAFASPSIRGDKSVARWRRVVLPGALTLLLGFCLFSLPSPPGTGLDASWQEMLVLARAQGLQFGRDVIFTWGPWGFLCSNFHLGSLEAVPQLAWQVGGQLLIALALVTLTRGLPATRRIAFVLSVMAFHWLFLDGIYFVLVALVGISGLMRRGSPVLTLVAWALVLGFVSQLKFTYLAVSAFAVVCAAACWAGRRDRTRAVAIPCGYAAAVFAAWVAAGQDPDNLYPYLRRSMEIASGYGDAMALDESWSQFGWGLGLVLICAASLAGAWRRLEDRPLALGACGLLSFMVFAMWKESFTRADMVPLGGHIFGIFTFVLMLAPVMPGLLFPGRRWHGFDLAFVYCVLGIACFDPAYYRLGPRVVWQRSYGTAHALARLGSLPGEWQAEYDRARAAANLPRVRAAVGRGTTDVYDFSIGVAILNGLNVSPRPIFQGYSAYTPSLEGWNLRRYQSDRAPEFLLWKDERVDDRYPGMDDAPIVAGLAGHYEPLFAEGDYWLFRRVSPLARTPPALVTLLSRTVRLSEEVELPDEPDHAVWLEADAVPNALGRLRALAYKPAIINLVTTDDEGRMRTWRLPPAVARAGFMLVPSLQGGGDLAALAAGDLHSWVRSFRFEAPPGQGEFWSHVGVRASSMPGLPLPMLEQSRLLKLGIFGGPAVSLTSVVKMPVVDTPEGKALLLHAEGEIVFDAPRGSARLSLAFGIREGAYSGGGHTDGVAFSADAVWPSGRRTRLWARYLDPVAEPADRGTQVADIALPADGPYRVVLHTGAGPANDNRWDWSYLTRVRFDAPGAK